MNAAKKFWSLVDKTQSCWEWTRSTGSHGYGQYYVEPSKPLAAHRYAWTATFGKIPDGLFVLHKCDNKKCVRPDHLFLGTQKENMRDMCNKGRHSKECSKGDDNPNTKISDADVIEIKKRWIRGTRQIPGNALALSIEYGVTRARIYQLASGRSR